MPGSWIASRHTHVSRLGRKTTIPKKQQAILWSFFDRVRSALSAGGLLTTAQLFTKLAAAIESEKRSPFDFAIVDEAQDLTVAHLRFFAALGMGRPNSLFFAGDCKGFSSSLLLARTRRRHPRAFSQPQRNYRTSHQIRTQSDRLLGGEMTDLDGNPQDRSKTISVFNGPIPTIRTFNGEEDEIDGVAKWLLARAKEGVVPQEFGICPIGRATPARSCRR